MSIINGKHPSVSEVTMTELILPNDTNVLGNMLGGRMMHLIDIAAALTASKHSRQVVTTVSVDSLVFRHPVRMGEMVMLKAKITWAGRTSMEVLVKAYTENLRTGEVTLTNEAFLSFVALDEDGKPTQVPPVIPETDEEKHYYCEAEKRRVERLRKKGK